MFFSPPSGPGESCWDHTGRHRRTRAPRATRTHRIAICNTHARPHPGANSVHATMQTASASPLSSTGTFSTCVVIGAGISGVATAKTFLQRGIGTVVIEATEHVGGLWQFRENAEGGVMSCTTINVTTSNYSFSDFPFDHRFTRRDYADHRQMSAYINGYVDHFGVRPHIRFRQAVRRVTRAVPGAADGANWVLHIERTPVGSGGGDGGGGGGGGGGDSDGHSERNDVYQLRCRYLAVASGHHSQPKHVRFPGQETFPGEVFHSAAYKHRRQVEGRRTLVVGIGNSAVDVAVDALPVARGPVILSTRSGAWVTPNYLFGYPVDYYACRAFFAFPRAVAQKLFESLVSVVDGHPTRWGFNPSHGALEAQPTVSGTLSFHVRRESVQVKPNVRSFDGSTVHFADGTAAEFDAVIMCTGYRVSVPFFRAEDGFAFVEGMRSNNVDLYKNVFCPSTGPTLAFVGFAQPASGGLLLMSEIQARWFLEICCGLEQQRHGGGGGAAAAASKAPRGVRLPSPAKMRAVIAQEKEAVARKYHKSERHTIQRDPIPYCDEIASFFGAKPSLWRHPGLLMNLLFGSGGSAQWRLQGPDAWPGAKAAVRAVPVTPMMRWTFYSLVALVVGGATAAATNRTVAVAVLLALWVFFGRHRKPRKQH